MKNVYNPVCDFGIPEKQCCFWVRAAVQTMRLSAREKRNNEPYIYMASFPKNTQNTLPK